MKLWKCGAADVSTNTTTIPTSRARGEASTALPKSEGRTRSSVNTHKWVAKNLINLWYCCKPQRGGEVKGTDNDPTSNSVQGPNALDGDAEASSTTENNFTQALPQITSDLEFDVAQIMQSATEAGHITADPTNAIDEQSAQSIQGSEPPSGSNPVDLKSIAATWKIFSDTLDQSRATIATKMDEYHQETALNPAWDKMKVSLDNSFQSKKKIGESLDSMTATASEIRQLTAERKEIIAETNKSLDRNLEGLDKTLDSMDEINELLRRQLERKFS